jgi:hypothetical protein
MCFLYDLPCFALPLPALSYSMLCPILPCPAMTSPPLPCPTLSYSTLPCHAMPCTTLHDYDVHHHPPCWALLCSGRSAEAHTGRGGTGAGEGMGLGLGRLRSDTAKHVGNSLSYTPATGNGMLFLCIMAAIRAFLGSLPPAFFPSLDPSPPQPSLISFLL